MHTYRAVTTDDEEMRYEVGYFEPTDDGGENWHLLRTFNYASTAARFVNFLNGGTGELETEFVDD